MSDRASLILDELAGGERLTTDEIVESTGLERSAVSAELSALKNAGRAISGRGGWTLTDAAPAAPRRHEAPEPTSDPGRREKAKKRMAKVRAKRKEAPTTQTAKKPARAAHPAVAAIEAGLPPGAHYVFGITELGQLTITDRHDAQKTMRMSQVDTARLALALTRWATLIAVRGETEAA